jgi:hypothetical protein
MFKDFIPEVPGLMLTVLSAILNKILMSYLTGYRPDNTLNFTRIPSATVNQIYAACVGQVFTEWMTDTYARVNAGNRWTTLETSTVVILRAKGTYLLLSTSPPPEFLNSDV